MAYVSNNAEGGANGVTISTANSDDNSAGTALDKATNVTRTYSSDWAHSGSTSFKFVGASGLAPACGWESTTGGSAVVASPAKSFRCYFRFTAAPGASCDVVQIRNAGNGGSVQLRTDRKLNIINDVGSAAWVSSAALTADTTYRFEHRAKKGTGASDGTIEFAYFLGDSETPIDSFITTATNCGTADFIGYNFGKLTSTAFTETFYFDNVAMDDVEYLLGPYSGLPALVYNIDTAIRKIPTAGSNGDITITQLSGTTATISEPTSGNFQAEFPADHTDVLTFEIEAQADGPPISETFSIYPTSLTTELIYDGDEWI